MIAQTAPLTRRRFTVAEYYQMAEVGILTDGDRVELIDGDIIEMTPIGDRHAGQVDRLTNLFADHFRPYAHIRVQNPVHLDGYGEPEPDLLLLRPRADSYTSSHPTPEDVLLVVEVADTSAAYDREVKAPLYARFGLPEYWLDDIVQQALTVHRDPTPDGYRTVFMVHRGDRIAPVAFPDTPIAVTDILGEA